MTWQQTVDLETRGTEVRVVRKGESLLLIVVALAACSRQSPVAPPNQSDHAVELLVSSDLKGEVEPCGCNLEPLGGLARLSTALKSVSGQGPKHFLLHGNLLSEGHAPSPQAEAQFKLKRAFLNRTLPTLGLSLALPGPADRALPKDLQPGLIGGSPDLAPGAYHSLKGGLLIVREPVQSSLPKSPLKVLVSERSLDALRGDIESLQAAGIGLVLVGGQSGEQALWTSLADGIFLLRSGERGQNLARLELHLRGDGPLRELPGASKRKQELARLDQRIEAIREARDRLRVRQASPQAIAARDRQLVAARRARADKVNEPLPALPKTGNFVLYHPLVLDSQVADDPATARAVAEHHREVGDLNRQAESQRQCPEPDKTKAQYVGSKTCKTCHQAAYELWQQTPHSKAWKTLEDAGRDYDYACVSCHSAGFGDAQGFCKVTEAGDRLNVGCEACHGPGSRHAQTGDKAQIERDRGLAGCTSCHHPPHTKAFHLDDRLARILGPGHGANAAPGEP